jgi:hypothetical protein
MSRTKKASKIWGLPAIGEKYSEDVDITPEIAALMLSHNQANRPMSMSLAKKLSEKIQAGNWLYTHQGIAFSNVGTLLDGQHRLAAIIDSGEMVRMPVTYNLDPKTFDHIDVDGRLRTSSDLFAIRCPGVKNKSLVCATASMMLRGIQGYAKKKPPEEVARFAEEKQSLIVPFVQELTKGQNVVRRGPIVAAFCAAVRQEDGWAGPKGYRDRDTVMLSAMRLVEQDWMGKNDPLKALYNRLVNAATSSRVGAAFDTLEVYQLTVSALRADISSRKLRNVVGTEVDWGDANDQGGPMAVKRRPVNKTRLRKKKAAAGKSGA